MKHSADGKSGKANGVIFHTARCVVSWLEFYVIAGSGEEIVHLCFSLGSHSSGCEKIQKLMPGALFAEDCVLEERMVLLAGHYLQGELKHWPIVTDPLLVRSGTPFQQKVWKAIGAIAYGDTRTYGELAAGVGVPGSARAVGRACNANPLALITPCHRVVGRDSLGGFAGGLDMKHKLLALEKTAF